jgi:hypothetical protein
MVIGPSDVVDVKIILHQRRRTANLIDYITITYRYRPRGYPSLEFV